jgi:hypothetical protein
MTSEDTPAKPRRSPCASCPYRKNVPSGVWDESEYRKLTRYDGETFEQEALAVFMCHQQDGCVCAGWLGHRDPTELLAVRLGVMRGDLDEDSLDYSTTVPLFESGAKAAEHGLADLSAPSATAQAVITKIIRTHGPRLHSPNSDPTEDVSP